MAFWGSPRPAFVGHTTTTAESKKWLIYLGRHHSPSRRRTFRGPPPSFSCLYFDGFAALFRRPRDQEPQVIERPVCQRSRSLPTRGGFHVAVQHDGTGSGNWYPPNGLRGRTRCRDALEVHLSTYLTCLPQVGAKTPQVQRPRSPILTVAPLHVLCPGGQGGYYSSKHGSSGGRGAPQAPLQHIQLNWRYEDGDSWGCCECCSAVAKPTTRLKKRS